MQPNTPTDQTPQSTQTNQGAPFNTPPMQPTPKSKKPLIISLIIAALVIVAAGVALIVYFTMFNITKDDYQKALETAKSIEKKATDLNTKFAELPGDNDEEIAEAKDFVKKGIEDIRQTTEKLGKEKALNDKDVKEKGNAYISKLNKGIDYLEEYTDDVFTIRSFVNKCSAALEQKLDGSSKDALARSLNTLSDELSKCNDDFKEAEQKMVSEDARSLAKAFIEPYEVMHQQAKQAATAASAGNLEAYNQASKKMDQAAQDLSSNSSDVLKETAEKVKSLDSTTEYKALVKVLEEKIK